jgi:hypothetical protein
MSCRISIRERLGVKLDGWEAYIRAVGAQLDTNGSDILDRVQASKRRLRGALERLESEASEAETLATAARVGLQRASAHLRRQLVSPRPDSAAAYAAQQQAILASIAEIERQLDTISVGWLNGNMGAATRLDRAIDRAMRGMVRVEAELDAGGMLFRIEAGDADDLPPKAERELHERLRALSSAIATARALPDENAKSMESAIASQVGRLRDLFAARSR